MNILLVNKYWRKLGGVEEYCFLLEEVLRDRGHEVVPFSQAEPGVRPTPYSHYFVPPVDPAASDVRSQVRGAARALRGKATVTALENLLDDVQIDVAHVVHAYHQLGTAFLHLLAERNIPVVLSIHDYKLCCPSYRLLDDSTQRICTTCLDAPWKSPVAPAYKRCWKGSAAAGAVLGAEALSNKLNRPYLAAGRVLVSNELMRSCALAGGIPADRIRVVPNFWPLGDRVVDPQAVRSKSMLFVGRLVVEKGVDVLIRAAALTGVHVRIIGTGPLEGKLRQLAHDLHAPVEFLGALWGDDVEAQMLDAAALIIPSRWHEVSPLVAYQAMTLSLPVIASAVGGMPDLLGDGRGYLVSADDPDALAWQLRWVEDHQEDVRTRAAAAATYSATALSRERFVEHLGEAYADLGKPL